MKHITVICEGDSENAYIQQLQDFLDSENGLRPLVFVSSSKSVVGTGFFSLVKSKWQQVKRENKNSHCEVWVDYDLCHRNERESMTQYRQSRIKPFRFSYHNFEDFLILHHPEDVVNQWRDVFKATGHFENPLHDGDYNPLFRRLFPEYEKGRVFTYR